MKSSLLVLLLTFCVNIYSQNIWVGQTSVFDLRGYAIGAQVKGQYDMLQLSIGSTYNVSNKQISPLISVGVYFVNYNHLKIGSNIQLDRYLSFPSVNITKQLNDKWFMDFNIRPHTYTFLQSDFTIFYTIH